ncbi:MAG: hypothetical protein V4555_06660 [Acidobacteriota bacterium]
MLTLLLILALQTPAATNTATADPFAALEVYEGTWTVHAAHPFSGGTGPDTLVNHCTRGQAFYSCEQVVNGKPAALVVFTLSKTPGKYDVDSILPNGHASSDTDLMIEGDHWTFLTHGANGEASYKTENTFHGRDSIHFVIERSTDGAHWETVNQGDDTRVR